MNKEELKQFLKDHLKIRIEKDYGYDDTAVITVSLRLMKDDDFDWEEIDKDTIFIKG